MAATSYPVQVYLYDLSQGMAKMLSPGLLGKTIEGIWHTGIVVYGKEYYYGGGIQVAAPGTTVAGRPLRVIDMGSTSIPREVFEDFLREIAPRFTPDKYSLLKHNCNNFSSECAQFLTGKDIPSYITGLPEEALNTPIGQMLRPMIEQMENSFKSALPGHEVPNTHFSPPPTSSSAPSASSTQASKVMTVLSKPPKPLLSLDSNSKKFYTLIKVSNKRADAAFQLTAGELTQLREVVDLDQLGHSSSTAEIPASVVPLFVTKLFKWPPKKLFAVLGLFRAIVAHPNVAETLKPQPVLDELLGFADLEGSAPAPTPAQLMALACLSNMFACASLASDLCMSEAVLNVAVAAVNAGDPKLRMMGAALLHNCSVGMAQRGELSSDGTALQLPAEVTDNDAFLQVLGCAAEALHTESDPNVAYRLLLTAGRLAMDPHGAAMLVALELDPAQVFQRTDITGAQLTKELCALVDDVIILLGRVE